MSRRSRSAKIQEWTERFQRFQRSGQTVAQFCQAEGVSTPSWYLWKKRLGDVADQNRSRNGRSRKPSATRRPSPFHPLFLASPNQPANATIRLPNGTVIELRDDAPTIASVLERLWDRCLAGGE